MENIQTKAALGARPRKQLDALEAFSLAVKSDIKPKILVEILEELPDDKLAQLERYASMILKSASPYSDSYYQQAKRMFPAIGETKRLLLAAVLQEIEPRENTDGPHEERAKATKQQKDKTDKLLATYKPSPISEAELPYRDSNNLDFRTAEEQKEAALADRVISSVMKKLGYTGEQKLSGNLNIDLPGTPLPEAKSGDYLKYGRPVVAIYTFLEKLALSESSNNPEAEIEIKDGRKFVGKLQLGSARLADFKKASGERFTMQDFKADPDLQDRVALWHVADIDKAIDAIGDKANSYDRDGLRAVAHLGGKGGMRKYVRSKGMYNPKDQLGTSLQDYYDKFSR